MADTNSESDKQGGGTQDMTSRKQNEEERRKQNRTDDLENDNEEEVDDIFAESDDADDNSKGNEEGIAEILSLLNPYIIKGCEDKLKDLLETLGVTSLSHMEVLEERDFDGVIKVADFRLLMNRLKKKNNSGPTSRENAPKEYCVVLDNIVSKNMCNKIKKDEEILTKPERLKFVKAVADDIRENAEHVTKCLVLREASKLVQRYPTSFGCLVGDSADKAEAAAILSNGITHHIKYIVGENKRGKGSTDSDGPSAPKVPRFTKSQNYGLDQCRDLPNELQAGETSETQEAKRLVMVEMCNSGESVNLPALKKLMMETYCSQRRDIHRRLIMENLLKRWPFIGKHIILQNHFEFLMKLDLSKTVAAAVPLFEQMETFFRAETNKKRKGASKSIPDTLKKMLKNFDQGCKSASCHIITIMLCSMTYMKVPLEAVFIFFPEETSFDEVQASDALPDAGHPMIALLGKDPQLNPKAYVVCEKRCLSEDQISCAKAINVWFMAHFVFKYSYSRAASPILEFLQRKYFGITEPGTRQERRKLSTGGYYQSPPDMSPCFLQLMRAFKEYCSTWNVEL